MRYQDFMGARGSMIPRRSHIVRFFGQSFRNSAFPRMYHEIYRASGRYKRSESAAIWGY